MELLSKFSLEEITFIFQRGLQDLASLDFSQIKYSETDLALKVGTILVFLILLKIIWILIGRWFGWEKYSRKESGHLISGGNKRYLFARFILVIPTLALLAPLLAVLFAIANPYLATTKEEKRYVEARTRVDLRDVSGSMSSLFQKTGKSKAEIAMNAHLKFLEMRRGKNDRTAFWIFSSDPYPVQEDFIVDDEIYYLKTYDAPWELGGNINWTDTQWKKYTMPKSRYLSVAGQGGTELFKTLRVIIQLFDDDAKKQKLSLYKSNGRSVLIISDAEIYDLDQIKAGFREFGKRGIMPYIIFINGLNGPQYDEEGNEISVNTDTPFLLQEIERHGGKVFLVSDTDALNRAYLEIDKLEKSRIEIVKKTFKVPIFQNFIFMAILALIIIIPAGLVARLFRYP